MTRQKKTLTATLSYTGDGWTGKLIDAPDLVVQSPYSTRTVRTRLEKMVQERFGPNTEVTIVYELPPALQKKVQRFRADDEQLKALTDSLYNARVQISRECLSLGMTQHEVGELLGMQQSAIAQLLSRHKTDRQMRPATRRTPRK